MIRSKCRPVAIVFILAVAMGVAARVSAEGPRALHPDASAAGVVAAAPDDARDDASALIVTADFNRDGIADIAKVNLSTASGSGARFLSVLLGQADGTFRRVATTPVLGHDPRSLVVADFNGDGNLDLIVGDGDGSVIELLGDGKGHLISAGAIAQLGSVVSIAVSDFNHDGIPDLAVSDFGSNSVTILLGAGKGSFRPAWSFSLPMRGSVFRLAAADFNGDGIPDLAIANDDQNSFEVMLGNGNGTFTYAPALSNVKDPNSYCPS